MPRAIGLYTLYDQLVPQLQQGDIPRAGVSAASLVAPDAGLPTRAVLRLIVSPAAAKEVSLARRENPRAPPSRPLDAFDVVILIVSSFFVVPVYFLVLGVTYHHL